MGLLFWGAGMMTHKKALETLAKNVICAIYLIDEEMKKPSTPDRGKRIAKITNMLEFENDRALHFGLEYSFKKINNIKKRY
jgi:hypothetical protein